MFCLFNSKGCMCSNANPFAFVFKLFLFFWINKNDMRIKNTFAYYFKEYLLKTLNTNNIYTLCCADFSALLILRTPIYAFFIVVFKCYEYEIQKKKVELRSSQSSNLFSCNLVLFFFIYLYILIDLTDSKCFNQWITYEISNAQM